MTYFPTLSIVSFLKASINGSASIRGSSSNSISTLASSSVDDLGLIRTPVLHTGLGLGLGIPDSDAASPTSNSPFPGLGGWKNPLSRKGSMNKHRLRGPHQGHHSTPSDGRAWYSPTQEYLGQTQAGLSRTRTHTFNGGPSPSLSVIGPSPAGTPTSSSIILPASHPPPPAVSTSSTRPGLQIIGRSDGESTSADESSRASSWLGDDIDQGSSEPSTNSPQAVRLIFREGVVEKEVAGLASQVASPIESEEEVRADGEQ